MIITIFQKLLDSVSEEEKYNILNKWTAIIIEKKTDYTLVRQIIVVFIFILFIIFIIVQKQNQIRDKKLLKQSQIAQEKLNASI